MTMRMNITMTFKNISGYTARTIAICSCIIVCTICICIYSVKHCQIAHNYSNERAIIEKKLSGINSVVIASRGANTLIYAYDYKLPRTNMPDSIFYEGIGYKVLYIKDKNKSYGR